ncbi:hypothetical protein ZWY2020_058206 [Hordeum vulgare]|nr:hypothetical protein ZWY2020_058206 [Hordeum vulgare]
MDFTPPRCSHGIDHNQAESPIDPVPIAFAFPAGTVPMIGQPNGNGWKDVKFAEPICKIVFPMFQLLVPDNPIDKCVHHYNIYFDLKHQRFDVLDSTRSVDDASFTTHVEFFINNLKETWTHHYRSSKQKISHFPIEYVTTAKQDNM